MAYNVSKRYQEVIYSGDCNNTLRLKFNGIEYENADLVTEKVTVVSNILESGSKRFSLDNFVSKQCTIIMHDIDLNDIKEPISVEIGTFVDTDYEYVPIGIFNLQDTPTNDKGKTTLKLRDNRVKFDTPYNAMNLITDNGGSVTLIALLQDICNKVGVELATAEFSGMYKLNGMYDSTVNATNYVAYIAEQSGNIATIGRDGKLYLIDLNGALKEIKEQKNIYLDDALNRKVAKASISGYIEQDETPTPDNPIEVKTLKGKNILKLEDTNKTLQGLNVIVSNNIISVKGTPTQTTGFVTFNLNIDKLSFKKGDIVTNQLYNKQNGVGVVIPSLNSAGVSNITLNDTSYWHSGTLNNDVEFNTISLNVSLTNGNVDMVLYPMIEKGNLTSYLPYNTINTKIQNKNFVNFGDETSTIAGITTNYKKSELIFNGTTTGASNLLKTYNSIYSNYRYLGELDVGTYYFSTNIASGTFQKNKGTAFAIYLRDENRTNLANCYTREADNVFINGNKKINLSKKTKLFLQAYANSKDIIFNDLKIEFQLEKSENQSNYALHEEQNYQLSLGNRELCTNDTFINKNGKWYLHKKWNKVVLNGSENVSLRNNGDGVNTITFTTGISDHSITNLFAYCDKFSYSQASQDGVEGIGVPSNSASVYIEIKRSRLSTQNVAGFKEWLANNNIIIYYPLAESIEEEITDTTLIEQLNALNNMKLFKGINNITSDALLTLNYYTPKETIKIPDSIVESYDDSENFEISRVCYEDGTIKYEKGNEDKDTLYVNSGNMFVDSQEQIDTIYDKLNGFKISSFKTEKVLGNPAIDAYDLIEIENNGNKYITLGQNTFTFNGPFTQKFDTQIGKEQKKENVTITGLPTYKKYARTQIDNVEGRIIQEVGQTTSDLSDSLETYREKFNVDIETLQNAIADVNSKMIQTNESFTFEFNQSLTSLRKDLTNAQTLLNGTNEYTKQVQEYVRIKGATLELGKSDSALKLRLSNDIIQFFSGDNVTAYLSGTKLYILDSTILKRMQIGHWIDKEDENNNLNRVWEGES